MYRAIPASAGGRAASMRIVTVSELTRYLKDLIAEDYALQDVWAQGEISNYTQAASGHRYFVLKDGLEISLRRFCSSLLSHRLPLQHLMPPLPARMLDLS